MDCAGHKNGLAGGSYGLYNGYYGLYNSYYGLYNARLVCTTAIMVCTTAIMVCTMTVMVFATYRKDWRGDLGKVIVYLKYNMQLELRIATPKRLYMLNKTENS